MSSPVGGGDVSDIWKARLGWLVCCLRGKHSIGHYDVGEFRFDRKPDKPMRIGLIFCERCHAKAWFFADGDMF